jgi:hypothetical protein
MSKFQKVLLAIKNILFIDTDATPDAPENDQDVKGCWNCICSIIA